MPGKMVKNWRAYHKLRKKGMSKSSSARIANAMAKRGRRRRRRR